MIDATILAACLQSREAYERIAAFVDPAEFSPQGAVWWPLIADWYKRDPNAKSVDVQMLRDRGKRQVDPKHHKTVIGWYDDLPSEVSGVNVADELLTLRRQQRGLELAGALQSEGDAAKLDDMLQDYRDLLLASDLRKSEVRKATWDNTFHVLDDANKVKLYPRVLNSRLNGGAVLGDLLVIFGRPNAGKSAFALNLACGVARDGQEVVYITNEEAVEKTWMRMACNFCNKPESRIKEVPDKAREFADSKGMRNIHAYHMTPGSLPEIEQILNEHPKAVMLVVDQLRHLDGKGKSMNSKLEENATGLRNLVGKKQLVGVVVTQAGQHDPSSPPPLYLDMSDIDNSRTGLPGAADVIIGVGVDDKMKQHGTRAISLPKIKGGSDRNFTVQFYEETSRIV